MELGYQLRESESHYPPCTNLPINPSTKATTVLPLRNISSIDFLVQGTQKTYTNKVSCEQGERNLDSPAKVTRPGFLEDQGLQQGNHTKASQCRGQGQPPKVGPLNMKIILSQKLSKPNRLRKSLYPRPHPHCLKEFKQRIYSRKRAVTVENYIVI